MQYTIYFVKPNFFEYFGGDQMEYGKELLVAGISRK